MTHSTLVYFYFFLRLVMSMESLTPALELVPTINQKAKATATFQSVTPLRKYETNITNTTDFLEEDFFPWSCFSIEESRTRGISNWRFSNQRNLLLHCGKEGGFCRGCHPGGIVRYGRGTRYVESKFPDLPAKYGSWDTWKKKPGHLEAWNLNAIIMCTERSFGNCDPAAGYLKDCYCSDSAYQM